MKRANVIDIERAFKSANDKVHYISKHKDYWNRPAWELKYGVLYHEGSVVGKCNSELNIVIRYWTTCEIEYRYIYYKNPRWFKSNTNINYYNLSKDSITNYGSDIKSIIEDLLFGTYYRMVSLKLKLENYLNRNKYTNLKTLKLEYDLYRKTLSRIRINIVHWCKKYNIDFNGVYYYDRKFWWGEYIGYRYNYYNTYLKGDTNNIKNILLSRNLRNLLNAKIYYWDNCRNGVLKDKHIPFKKFLEIWKNPNNKKILKEEIENKIEEIKRKFEEKEERKKNKILQELPDLINKFRNYEIRTIHYEINKYCNEIFIRNHPNGEDIEFSNGGCSNKKTLRKLILLITTCFDNNITISERICRNRHIRVNNLHIREIDNSNICNINLYNNNIYNKYIVNINNTILKNLTNSQFWNVYCYEGRISFMEIIKYCIDNNIELYSYIATKRSIIKEYSK